MPAPRANPNSGSRAITYPDIRGPATSPDRSPSAEICSARSAARASISGVKATPCRLVNSHPLRSLAATCTAGGTPDAIEPAIPAEPRGCALTERSSERANSASPTSTTAPSPLAAVPALRAAAAGSAPARSSRASIRSPDWMSVRACRRRRSDSARRPSSNPVPSTAAMASSPAGPARAPATAATPIAPTASIIVPGARGRARAICRRPVAVRSGARKGLPGHSNDADANNRQVTTGQPGHARATARQAHRARARTAGRR